ncbi:uncharacterized protein FIBRA_08740 [Fibroporia radiculosa]|uniref:Fungal-type protein kinase domain-containing protein n=1 Tax=Fibroporia radiculosa TaxID=599839 RepID=J4GI54_9APHY|nr:uncharacterized protein FIBRA_08740 [Fibroporia radiculosa]CCM06473.1 predicted protein [Fibroporia radiculosa]
MRLHLTELPVQQFMDDFVAGPDPTDAVRATFEKPQEIGDRFKTGLSYLHFCAFLNSVLDSCAAETQDDKLVVKVTSRWEDTSELQTELMRSKQEYRPDLIIYPTTNMARKAYTLSKTDLQTLHIKKYIEHKARTSWAWALLPIQFVLEYTENLSVPFSFGSDTFFRTMDSDDWDPCLDKISQFIVYQKYARLLRWDRVGAVVSSSFDFVDNSTIVEKFFYRFGRMNREQRGFDPTVSFARPDYVQEMYSVREKLSDYQKECFSDTFGDDAIAATWPIYEVCMREDDFVKPDLISSARVEESAERFETAGGCNDRAGEQGSGLGQDKYLRFLVGKPRVTSSSLIGRATKGFVAYDIYLKRLVFLKDIWRVKSRSAVTELQVIETPGKRQTVAWGILHDWDMCAYKEVMEKDGAWGNRVGTWQFMSALLLKDPKKRNEVSDDIESFVHLINWLMLRFHPHNFSADGLRHHVKQEYEDHYIDDDNAKIGGRWKLLHIECGKVEFYPRSEVLQLLTQSLGAMCTRHYGTLVPYLRRLENLNSSPRESEQQPKGSPMLSDHSVILDILEELHEFEPSGDKCDDQFKWLRPEVLTPFLSGNSSSTYILASESSVSVGRKRSRGSMDPESLQVHRAKRAKVSGT